MPQTQQLVELLKPDNQETIDFSGAWYAEVAVDVQDFSDPMWVLIPDFSDTLVWGPCVWQSRDAQSLPHQGDLALAIYDNRRNMWIPCWWPFTDNTSSAVRPPNPSSKYPPSTAPPASGILKSVGGHPVEQRIQKGSGEGGGAGVPVTSSVQRGVIHDTEGAGDYNGQIDFMASAYFPNFAIGTDNGQVRITQFEPVGVSSDATAAHDFEIMCQIEIIAPSGAANYTTGQWRSWLTPIKSALQGLMGSVGVPMTYRGAPANRGQNWAQSGWFGHIDVPDNDHTDPGTGFPWSDYL